MDSADTELAEQLRLHGLDPSYWTDVLHSQLGITSPQQSQYLEEEDLEALNDSLRYKWEGKALRKFIGIEDKSAPSQANDDKAQIVAKLKEAGLDGEYWSDVLKNKLGVIRMEHIGNLDADDLMKLENEVKHAWEKKALKKMLGISAQVHEDFIQKPQGQQPWRGSIKPSKHVVPVQGHAVVSATNSDLTEQLHQAGLDASYWSDVLQTKLGITNAKQIHYLKKGDMEILKPFLRQTWEEEGLRQVFGIINESTSAAGANDDTIQMVAKLSEVGLDGEYWVDVMKNKLGITQREQIENLNIDDLKELEEAIRHEWEKLALKKLFGISNKTNTDSIEKHVVHVVQHMQTRNHDGSTSIPKVPRERKMDMRNIHEGIPFYDGQRPRRGQRARRVFGPVPPEIFSFPDRQRRVPTKPCTHVVSVQHKSLTSLNNQNPHRASVKSTAGPVQSAFEDILVKLGLQKFYPSKISTLDARIIKQGSERPTLVDIPWIIIQKLFRIDFHARDEVWSLMKVSIKGARHDKGDDFDVDEFIQECQNSSKDVDDVDATLNTLDVLVATFTCCDNMLKQTLVEKLFVCKLAIPFLYPQGPENNIVMSLWALRTIIVQRHNEDQNEITETQVTEKPFPIVTFVRLGRPPVSKSKFVNDILRDNSHDTFVHHDCNNGAIPRKLTDGLVECSWFVTAGKEKEHLPCTTMFLNMRGDASLMKKQMQLLQEISSVVFVIATAQDLVKVPNAKVCQQLYRSSAKVILYLISGNSTNERQACVETLGRDFFRSVRIISSMHQGNQKNASDLKTEARRKLSETIATCPGILLNKCGRLAAEKGIIVDEYVDDACLRGRDLAEKVLSHMKDKQIVECKSELLPLQGDEWLEYCKLKKQQHRSAKGSQVSSANQADQLKQKMDQLRKKQVEKGDNGLTPFVQEFMSTLQQDQGVVLYFLKWMNMLLDEKSRANLPGLRKRYHTLWAEFQRAKKDQEEERMQKLKLQVDDAEHKLASASLGLENLFRELGQVYEAFKESREIEKDTRVKYLPKIAAKLLAKGIPLELIDGDASSVPISWVKAVLKEVGNILEGKKIFVLSVLGIQSSGKSTLLNTMFGLKFAVSAGRCTRGAYMQLISVDDTAGLPFEYIVVVDTEGLRAPELGQQKHEHDNELATLVIGLGDVTIINIKGENTEEVKDTLQIAVHAFLRMNLVRNNMEDHRSCIFVHQNVPAANAETMMLHGCQKLQEDLDEMAKEAAYSENIASINSFAQIINFDVQKHVWYISDLWHGDPPMAPANPGYSERVNSVRLTLLRDIMKGKTSFLTASDLSLRLEDLWNGVLADDFVFSFRNSLEMKAYTGLQSEYYQLEWKLQKHLKDWLQDEAETELNSCETTGDLDDTFQSLVVELSKFLTEKAEEMKTYLNKYFEKSNLQDIIVQWQQSKLNQLNSAVDQLTDEGRADLQSIKASRMVEIMQTQKREEDEARIMEKAVELAKQLKGKQVTDSELKTRFDSMWKPVVNDLASKSADREQRIDLVMQEILYNRLSNSASLLRDELLRSPLNNPPEFTYLERSITERDVKDDHISMKETMGKMIKEAVSYVGLSTHPVSRAKRKTSDETNRILKDINDYIKELLSSDTKFRKSYAVEIIQKLIEGLDSYNRKATKSDKYTFTILPTYYVKLAVHVSRYCVQVFDLMQREYIKKHGVKAKLRNYKNTAWILFQNTVKQSSEEETAGDLFCTKLKDVIIKAVKAKLPQQCVEEVLRDFQMTKYYLIVNIMDDLARREDFDDFSSYIRNAKEFALRWVRRYTKDKIFSQRGISRYTEMANTHIAKVISCVKESVKQATSEVTKSRTKPAAKQERMTLWISHFSKKVKEKKIAVPISSLIHVNGRKVGDFKNFERIILDQLDTNVKDSLERDFRGKTEASIDWDGKPPSELIIDTIWGCPEQCRFCDEPCADNLDGHYSSSGKSHTCVQHRPDGVGGVKWNNDGTFEGVWHSKGELGVQSCNYLVQCKDIGFICKACTNKSEGEVSHKYIEYKTCMKDWDIAPDTTNSVSKYWMWFMATFRYKLGNLHNGKPPNIPKSWESVTKDEALEDIRKYQH